MLIRPSLKKNQHSMTAVDRVPQAGTLVFPKGSFAITLATDDNLKSELKALAGKLRSLGDAIPPEIAQEADDLLAEWLVIYENSEQSTAAKQKSVADKRASRKVLAWELYLNILEIVRLFPNDKRAIERYSVQSLLGFTKPRGGR